MNEANKKSRKVKSALDLGPKEWVLLEGRTARAKKALPGMPPLMVVWLTRQRGGVQEQSKMALRRRSFAQEFSDTKIAFGILVP
jgi:hypothetical protein